REIETRGDDRVPNTSRRRGGGSSGATPRQSRHPPPAQSGFAQHQSHRGLMADGSGVYHRCVPLRSFRLPRQTDRSDRVAPRRSDGFERAAVSQLVGRKETRVGGSCSTGGSRVAVAGATAPRARERTASPDRLGVLRKDNRGETPPFGGSRRRAHRASDEATRRQDQTKTVTPSRASTAAA